MLYQKEVKPAKGLNNLEDLEDTTMILKLSHPSSINLTDNESINGVNIVYRSHLERGESMAQKSYFRYNNQMYNQGINSSIYKSKFGIHENVTMLTVSFSSKNKMLLMPDVNDFIYGKQVQLKLHKQYLKFVDPREFEYKQDLIKNKDKARDQTTKRKAQRDAYDKVRNQTPKRKDQIDTIDKVRNQTPKRKAQKDEIDKVRNQTPKRKAQKDAIDKVRNQTPKRKAQKDAIDKVRNQTLKIKSKKNAFDKVRNQTPKRKAQKDAMDSVRNQTLKIKSKKDAFDKIRDQIPKRKQYNKLKLSSYEYTETRRIYRAIKDRKKQIGLLLKSLSTETGFDVLCSSCLQYKNKNSCKQLSEIMQNKAKKFLIQKCYLLKNREEQQYICNLCLKDVKENKMPKRSHINSFKFANFPRSFIVNLKQKCAFKEQASKTEVILDTENYEREALKLNRLEANLLKIVIPFIRIAHCPRGSYFKVKGDLILISSDIPHSLSKILPVQQCLIPVSFKRKLSYTGSYIEEYVEKEKIKMYFAWFKKYNHLFKSIELDSNLIEEFESESSTASCEFENSTKEEGFVNSSDGIGFGLSVVCLQTWSLFLFSQKGFVQRIFYMPSYVPKKCGSKWWDPCSLINPS